MELWIHRLSTGRAKGGNLKQGVFGSFFESMQVQLPLSLCLWCSITQYIPSFSKSQELGGGSQNQEEKKMTVYMFIHAQVRAVTYESLLGNGSSL